MVVRLSNFIERDMEAILREWEGFAATLLPAAAEMDSTALRDHAENVLLAACKDIDTFQTDGQREDKSKGLAAGPQLTLVIRQPQVYAHSLQSGMASVAERVTARVLSEQPKLRVVPSENPPAVRRFALGADFGRATC